MKKINYIIASFAVLAGLSMTSCVKDLEVTPIDPNLATADKALTTPEDFDAFMAQLYTGFVTSGSYGPNGDNNIQKVDGGYSQYLRALYYLQETTTDESICCWDDKTVQTLHYFTFTTSDEFIYSCYVRIFYQIAMCNEFIRQGEKTNLAVAKMPQYIAEAKALRAYCWLNAIDLFGNVPFSDETASVGSTAPQRIDRAGLFEYIEKQCKELLEGQDLPEATGDSKYYRANKDFVRCVLAKLYLNAEVFIGTPKYNECATVLNDIKNYKLHDNYAELFLADNNETCQDEIIFAFTYDGNETQSYGGTNFIIFASTDAEGEMDVTQLGISSGWGGLRVTPEFYDSFDTKDQRAMFFTGGSQQKDITFNNNFKYGYPAMKFRNIRSDGKPAKNLGFVDTDFPLFRYADVLLMKAECALKGSTVIGIDEGLEELNKVRVRAGLKGLSKDEFTEVNIVRERGNEFYQELWRRQDLVRFNMFTGDKYIWQWKGGVHDGMSIDKHFNLFPIPTADLMANSNLVQNEGY